MTDLFAKRRQKLLALGALRDKQGGFPQKSEADFHCPDCNRPILPGEYPLSVCTHCGHHGAMGGYQRLHNILDKGSFRQLDWKIQENLFDFPDYQKKLEKSRQKTGLSEAVVCATGKIQGHGAVVAVMDSRFMMGSMGTEVGERITRAIEYATAKKTPLIIFSASGGARMQEGILSLMQMAKTSGALSKLGEGGVPYISVLTNPTTGGVTASFASLGDVILAEPGALIGFAGPRVIQQTIGQELPEGFQRSEYLLDHGFLDAIIPRDQMRDKLAQLLKLHKKGGRLI